MIETSRLQCEPILLDHAEIMFTLLQDERIYHFLPEYPPATLDALSNRYQFLSEGRSPDNKEYWLNWILRLQCDNSPIGYFQATIHEPEWGQVAYVINPKYWGKGYASEAASTLITHLFKTYTIPIVEAYIDTRNERSIRLAKSIGLRYMRTIINADEFKGSSSDEYVYASSYEEWSISHKLT